MEPGGHPVHAGFVLAGGRSSRMGQDKALLILDGTPLVTRVANQVQKAAGNATIIGPPERYVSLGFPVVPDCLPGRGPLGGLLTALETTAAPWNLLVACDMPNIDAALLQALLNAAESCGALALVPETPVGTQPLCAVYHRGLLPAVRAALDRNSLRMKDFIASIDARMWPLSPDLRLANVNTPEDWAHLEVFR